MHKYTCSKPAKNMLAGCSNSLLLISERPEKSKPTNTPQNGYYHHHCFVKPALFNGLSNSASNSICVMSGRELIGSLFMRRWSPLKQKYGVRTNKYATTVSIHHNTFGAPNSVFLCITGVTCGHHSLAIRTLCLFLLSPMLLAQESQ